MQYGVVIVLAMLYAVAGLVMGVRSLMEKDIFRFFSNCRYLVKSAGNVSQRRYILFRSDLRWIL